ncbi:uncharacterized protein ASPGLDRAFT_718844 [Aspergillus glaucus CBS 516.65]|uniref:Uncharacterized protein n=1 Tax=Aspergillus glaucus CBS 516.65 TaxID=1160497 RepID=A0A1L9VXC9_ASPGL|nr:hypothetical protein ASPGLDRAFT_718844 [Aspergillus glaucus CBS 516.65]OJJ88549.1 hypothetical protein ASPGLDRAFT_718844 [Aspergillus glaucus CBS 516.65]
MTDHLTVAKSALPRPALNSMRRRTFRNRENPTPMQQNHVSHYGMEKIKTHSQVSKAFHGHSRIPAQSRSISFFDAFWTTHSPSAEFVRCGSALFGQRCEGKKKWRS